MHRAIFLLTAACSLAIPVSAQEAPATAAPQKTISLRVGLRVGEPVLVRVQETGRGTVTVSRGEEQLAVEKGDHVRRIRVVDEYSELSDETVAMSRTVLSWEVESKKKIEDPSFVGARIEYRKDKGKPMEASLADGRLALRKELDELLPFGEGVGPWMYLPEEAQEGETLDLDFADFIPFVLDASAMDRAKGKMKLEPLNGNKAVLTGDLECRWVETEDGNDLTITTNGQARLELDIEARRIVSFTYDYSAAAVGTMEGMNVRGDLKSKVELTAEVGRAAVQARNQLPKVRDRWVDLPENALQVQLPVVYMKNGLQGGAHILLNTSPPGPEAWQIEILCDGSPDVPAAMAQLRKQMEQEFPKAKFTSASGGMGKGFAFTIKTDDNTVSLVFLGGKDRLVRFRLLCPDKSLPKAQNDLKQAVRTLRTVP